MISSEGGRLMERGVAKINVRLPDDLRAKVERDAAARDMAMNKVIIERLERSFSEDSEGKRRIEDLFGGEHIYKFMLAIAQVVRMIEQRSGKPIFDWLTYRSIQEGITKFLKALEPEPTKEERDAAIAEPVAGGLLSGGGISQLQGALFTGSRTADEVIAALAAVGRRSRAKRGRAEP
jgi:Arc-like DNA binding dprotein